MMLKAHFTYDMNVLTSYEFCNWADRVFGADNIVSYEEVRDGYGYLKGFDLEINVGGEELRTGAASEAIGRA